MQMITPAPYQLTDVLATKPFRSLLSQHLPMPLSKLNLLAMMFFVHNFTDRVPIYDSQENHGSTT